MDEAGLFRDEIQKQFTNVQTQLATVLKNQEDANKALLLINGSIQRHEEEIFGNPSRNTSGLLPDVAELKQAWNNARVILRTVQVGAGLLGLTNVGAIVIFWRSLGAG